MKKFYSLIFIFLALSISLTLEAAPCNTDGSGAITNISENCTSTPDTYIIHLYKSGLCNGIDPSSESLPDINANCFITYDSGVSPLSVTVKDGVSSALSSGTITKPPNGTYTHGFVLIRYDIDMQTSKTFSNTITASDTSTGNICWTKTGIAGQGNYTSCAMSIGSQGFTTTHVDNLSGSGDCTAGGLPKFHCTYDESPYDLTYAYLVTSSDAKATSSGEVAKLLGFATFTTPVTVSDSSSAEIIQFRVTQGVTLDFSGGALNMYSAAFKVLTGIE